MPGAVGTDKGGAQGMSPAYIPAILVVNSVTGSGRDVPVPNSGTFAKSREQAGFRRGLWGSVLAEQVDEAGLVDYRAVRFDDRFREYLYRLANNNPDENRWDTTYTGYDWKLNLQR